MEYQSGFCEKTKLIDGRRNLATVQILTSPTPWRGAIPRFWSNLCLPVFKPSFHKFAGPQNTFFLHLNLLHTRHLQKRCTGLALLPVPGTVNLSPNFSGPSKIPPSCYDQPLKTQAQAPPLRPLRCPSTPDPLCSHIGHCAAASELPSTRTRASFSLTLDP